MILQNTNSIFNLFWIESFDSRECATLESHEKKSVDCRSKEQRRAFSELSFELVSMSLRQWFYKTLIPDSTYFELKVLIAECAALESHEKKSVGCRSNEQRRAFSELSFGLASMLSMQWFCKIPFPDSRYWSFHFIYLFKFSVCALNFMCA